MNSKTVRHLTICSGYNNKSSLIIKTKWLKEHGFRPGDLIELDISKLDTIVITNKGNKFNN